MQFKKNVISGIEYMHIKSIHNLFFTKNIPKPTNGKTIIAVYNMQSGSIGIHRGKKESFC